MENDNENDKHAINGEVLLVDYMYKIGDFEILLDERGELKIRVKSAKNRLYIKPNSDNSCTMVSNR